MVLANQPNSDVGVPNTAVRGWHLKTMVWNKVIQQQCWLLYIAVEPSLKFEKPFEQRCRLLYSDVQLKPKENVLGRMFLNIDVGLATSMSGQFLLPWQDQREQQCSLLNIDVGT